MTAKAWTWARNQDGKPIYLMDESNAMVLHIQVPLVGKNSYLWVDCDKTANILAAAPIGYALAEAVLLVGDGKADWIDGIEKLARQFMAAANGDSPAACGTCGGEGVVDSGAKGQDDQWINVPCPECSKAEPDSTS